MKILISALSFPTSQNQIAAFLEVLAKEMVRQNHEVTVIAPQSLTTCWKHKIPLCPQKYVDEVETPMGIRSLTVLRPYSLTLGQGRFNRLSHRIDRFCVNRSLHKLKEKPDVVYSHFWWAAEHIVDYSVKNNIPAFVATGEHIINIDKYLPNERIKFLADNISGVICVSSKNQEESIAHGLTDGRNTIVLPNAVDELLFYKKDKSDVRKELGIPQDAFIVAFCGRFSKRKGCGRLSEAIKKLNDPMVKSFFIGMQAGEGLDNPDCEGILFKGQLQHDKIADYLNAADVFCLPTLAEGCSNSIVEAMACGLPVISSDLPFNYDVLGDDNAIMIDPMNVDQIARSIKLLKDNAVLRKKMSEAALNRAKSLTISGRVNRIIDFMKLKMQWWKPKQINR